VKPDRESIGLTSDAQVAIRTIMATGWFAEAQDIGRFALAYAIRETTPIGDADQTDTRWAAGNFDSSGDIRVLLNLLYPDCETPVRLMEHFVNHGIMLLASKLEQGTSDPMSFIGVDQ
jgi:hypothetical protein